MDAISSSRLVGLHPVLVDRYTNFDGQLMAASISFRLTNGLRSWAVQAQDYALGRDADGVVVDQTKVVTDAPPGTSWHQYGLAFDGCPMVAGEPDWDTAGPNWVKVYGVYQGCGFFCGKDYRGRFKDPDHFQLAELPESPTAEDLQDLKDAGASVVWKHYFPNS